MATESGRETNAAWPDTENGNDVTTYTSVLELNDDSVLSMIVESARRLERLAVVDLTIAGYGQVKYSTLEHVNTSVSVYTSHVS